MMALWHNLHFLRPQWLWALLLVPALLLAGWYRWRHAADWRRAVDPHLLPHLLQGDGRHGNARWLLAALGAALAVLALAGPSWRQVEQRLWQSKLPLVVVLDLSSRIATPDLPPSRLLQARAKLARLLEQRHGGEIALVAYADEPFTVAPLTDDAANVGLFLDALGPQVMPVDGQRSDRALHWAGQLLRQAHARNGQILLMSDRADAAASTAAARLHAAGYKVSVLGVGTPQGAFYRDREGGTVHAALDEASLQGLAIAGGGSYARLAATDADLQALGVLQPQAADADRPGTQAGKTWQDQGYWLLPPLLLLALLAFRRPRGLAVLLLGLWLPLAMPAQAAEPGSWWQRADQLQHQRLAAGVQAYRKGDFAAAQRSFEGIDDAEGRYNLGNALARQGHYDEAIAAYDQALKLQPDMADAKANRAAVEAARQRQPPPTAAGKQQDPSNPQPGKDNPGQQSPGDGGQDSQSGQPQDADAAQGRDDARQQAQPPPDKPAGQDDAGQGGDKQEHAPQPATAHDQQQADQAQRERMAEAMRQQQAQAEDEQQQAKAQAAMSPQERERRRAVDAWMQRVPDEPGDLLRAKFRLEYERRRQEGK